MISIKIISPGSESPFKMHDVVLVDPSVVPRSGDYVVVERGGEFRCTRWQPGLSKILGTVVSIINERHMRRRDPLGSREQGRMATLRLPKT